MCDLLGSHNEVLPPVVVGVLPAEVLGHLPGGELSLADVAEVPGQVDGLPLHQGSQQGHVTRLSPPGRKAQTQPVKLVPKLLSTILGLCPVNVYILIRSLLATYIAKINNKDALLLGSLTEGPKQGPTRHRPMVQSTTCDDKTATYHFLVPFVP